MQPVGCITRLSPITDMHKRLHIYYSGLIQGVGFRFTAERIALSLGLTGWVMNLSDGRVEIVCEGKEAVLKIFLQKIRDAFKEYIRDEDIEESEPARDFDNFEIRF